jgi:glycosyltransferase involved in cell wall biosynthesis
MKLTVLSVAYPFAPVGPDAVGGAEQVLSMLDRALVATGHRSIVIAQEGSSASGPLIPIPVERGVIDQVARDRAHRLQRVAIQDALERWPIDLIHMHGHDFNHCLPPPGPPVLVTLHVPAEWYAPEVFHLARPNTFLHCVSATQRRAFPPHFRLLPDIENGVDCNPLTTGARKRLFAISLGRICAEKGFHLALDAARQAGVPFLLAGEVFPYEAHQQYFREEIAPRLDRLRQFIGRVGFNRKQRLLAAARCLLAPSLVAETSSLVAMEALAGGTPVIAFPSGALAEIVEHGKTGFLVRNAFEMAEAIRALDLLKPEDCRRAAHERFSADRTAHRYLNLYQQLSMQKEPVLSTAF